MHLVHPKKFTTISKQRVFCTTCVGIQNTATRKITVFNTVCSLEGIVNKFQVAEEHLNIVEALQQLCCAETTGNSHGGRDRDRRKIHSHHCLRPHLWHKKYTAQGRWANPSRFGGNLEVCFDQIWGLLWNSKSAL